jgi:hypothetical protein
LQWYIHSRSTCEYDNGYLVFDTFGVKSDVKEVWRMASDFATVNEFAADAPPRDQQMAISAIAAEMCHHYAPRGQFRPWALLRFDEAVFVDRLLYPTLICAGLNHTFLYDVRTGSCVQTINTNLRSIYSVDVNERHAFVCERDVVHVFSLESGIEVLRIPADVAVWCSQSVQDPYLVPGDWFISPLSVSLEVDESPCPSFIRGVFTRTLRLTQRFTDISPSSSL